MFLTKDISSIQKHSDTYKKIERNIKNAILKNELNTSMKKTLRDFSRLVQSQSKEKE